jgi:CHAD domain-containing protein
MSFNPEELAASFRKMRKSLKAAQSDLSPEDVHRFRTNASRLETLIDSLELNARPSGKRLRRMIASHRKKAGKVRDMDVQIGLAASLASHGEEEAGLVQLLAHMGERREKFARRLSSTLEKDWKYSRRALKRKEEYLQKHLVRAKRQGEQAWEKKREENVLELAKLLANGPKLNAGNLHAFRLQVKQLSNLLKLEKQPGPGLLDMLTAAKDAVGEWHDWLSLKDIANKLLDRRPSVLRQKINSLVKCKLAHALLVAGNLRKRCLGMVI